MNPTETGLILIVDDTPTNLEVICEALSDRGFEVAIAISGERALQQIQREAPDLILLDIMMPGIDGFETCRRLKADSRTCDIPIIFMTALSDSESKVKALNLGGVDYVTKPFQEEEVLARIQTHLRLRQLALSLEQEVHQKSIELHAAHLKVIQQEKMSSLGNLVAGVAHEINNPIGFLSGSVKNAQEYIQGLISHISLYQQHYPTPIMAIQEHGKTIDLEYITEDLPKMLVSMQGASNRIIAISNSLRIFSRADNEHIVPANIHEGIDSTILILKYRIKANEHRPEIQITQEYGNLPLIKCFPGQLNQVFMNILANAIDMFDEMAQSQSYEELVTNPQKITISTKITDNRVQIQIVDNGKGMPKEIQDRIFDHLFTTKSVGQGTGLGLSIVRQIIEEKHGGKILVNSRLGEGSEFKIEIPV